MDHGPSGLRSFGVLGVAGLVVVAGYVAVGALVSPPQASTDPFSSLLDADFGDAATPGVVHLDPATGFRTVALALPLPDGSLVLNVAATDVNGLPAEPYGLARLDPDGQLDATFGDPATPGFVGSTLATAMAVDAQGRILVAGDGRIFRYTPAGAADVSFVRHFVWDPANPPPPSTPGEVRVRGEVDRILVLSDGSIVVAGTGHPADGTSTVTKLLPDGDYDATFGALDTPGMVTLPFTPIVGPVELHGGRLGVAPTQFVAVGTIPNPPSRAVMYVLTGAGLLDPTVGGGTGVVDLGPPGVALHDVVRSGDRLLVRGWADGAADGLVLATDLDGVLDESWANGGRLPLADLGQHGGQLISWPDRPGIGIQFWTDWDAPAMLVRLTDDGDLDGSFGGDPLNPGWLVLDPPAASGHAHWLAFAGVSGGAVVGAGREGAPPAGGVWSWAEVLRTIRFDAAPQPAPVKPYAPPLPPTSSSSTTSTAPVVSSVPATTTTTATATTTTTPAPTLRLDGPAVVHSPAVRIRP